MVFSYMLIGGGSIRRKETIELDEYILRRLRNPRALYIPGKDNSCTQFAEYYESLGGTVECLEVESDYSRDEVFRMLSESDVLYLGGGDPRLLLNRMDALGISEYLRKESFRRKDLLIVGMSAGMMILGEKYNTSLKPSDVMNGAIKYSDGLNMFRNTIFEPHLSDMNRIGHLYCDSLFAKIAVGVDDNTALFCEEGIWRVIGRGYVVVLIRKKKGVGVGVFAEGQNINLSELRHEEYTN